ncbi:hypothetical protein B0J11DRAFT_323795 [Dendryphion nanum]|uniref:Uncharacterized protein n=1 Tax=Dendryphion nanum TaxID=256645 RepID=A0A9P9DRT7_9PLEO|nr:hypothetical protein B0J11DRAFT_323795 [Dendryphion nanum]
MKSKRVEWGSRGAIENRLSLSSMMQCEISCGRRKLLSVSRGAVKLQFRLEISMTRQSAGIRSSLIRPAVRFWGRQKRAPGNVTRKKISINQEQKGPRFFKFVSGDSSIPSTVAINRPALAYHLPHRFNHWNTSDPSFRVPKDRHETDNRPQNSAIVPPKRKFSSATVCAWNGTLSHPRAWEMGNRRLSLDRASHTMMVHAPCLSVKAAACSCSF